MSQAYPTPSSHPAFEWVRSETIASLGLCMEEYRHRQTGARHFHLHCDNKENVFLIGFRTIPTDSTGVAHILEHTVLCGSEKYPVRDPFFMMIRRSLNTFMNAFTSADWTAYPFASQNRKDFNNLLEVYLDAVFFSRLDPLDFAQEGHRLEFVDNDPAAELVYKGVVYNEMKGAMSAISSVLWQAISEALFSDSTYHFNSGGDPAVIPQLSYQQLQDFYRRHYHPGNAIIMTYGDIPAAEHQQVFEEKALSRFQDQGETIRVAAEPRLSAPRRIEQRYALDRQTPCAGNSHILVGWMLGESSDLQQQLEAHFLANVLLDNSASPLQQVLETTTLGKAPSPLCGLEDSSREMVFVCGLEGSDPEQLDAVEQLILNTLQDVAEHGVDQAQLEAVLHQLELHQREIGGDGFPYGLQLIMSCLGTAMHDGDPFAVLDIDPVLASLREKIRDPNYIKSLAQQLLLDNPHRVTLLMRPDHELQEQQEQQEKQRLQQQCAALNEQDKLAIIECSQQLQARQQQQDDESILPKVGLDDINPELPSPDWQEHPQPHPVTAYAQGTNGLVYEQLIIDLPALSAAQLLLLPYYSKVLTELGLGDDSYLQTQAEQAAICGSIHAYSSLRGAIDDVQAVSGKLVLSAKALSRNHKAQTALLERTFRQQYFREPERIRELVSQMRARREQSVTGNGHGLAMLAATSGMSPTAQLDHQQHGLAGIQAIKKLDNELQQTEPLNGFNADLQALHQQLQTAPKQSLLIAESEHIAAGVNHIQSHWQGETTTTSSLQLPSIREPQRQWWIANTQVNFCAKAYPTVPVAHPDAAALTVLGNVLRNGFLHRAIREQGGAYGAGASQKLAIAAFCFYSYRDPRLGETLADFDASIEWLLNHNHDYETLEQAILGVIGSIDKPASPAGEAKHDFHNRLFGRSVQQRRQFRQAILGVTIKDLQAVARRYLLDQTASIAVISNQQVTDKQQDYCQQHGFEQFIL